MKIRKSSRGRPGPYYTTIRVDQLPLSTSAQLVQSILSEGEMVPELKNLILTKAAGNPLIMEELTRSLLENGSIEKKDDRYLLKRKPSDIEIPDTIQGIIAARMQSPAGKAAPNGIYKRGSRKKENEGWRTSARPESQRAHDSSEGGNRLR